LNITAIGPFFAADVAAEAQLGAGILEAGRLVVVVGVQAVIVAAVPVEAELRKAVGVDRELLGRGGQSALAGARVGQQLGGVGTALIQRLGVGSAGDRARDQRDPSNPGLHSRLL
jgi:hypothetical protein